MIKSSFKKKDTTAVPKDTNRYFFGCPDLDNIFNNELLKATLFLIEEDTPTKHFISLIRYYIGCGYHTNQNIIIYDNIPQRWESMIPAVISSSKDAKKLAEENKTTSTDKTVIAWRYDNMDIKLKEENVNKEIPPVDLSKHVDQHSEEYKAKNLLNVIDLNKFNTLKALLEHIHATMLDSLKNSNDQTLKRFVFPSFFSPLWTVKFTSAELRKFFSALKVLFRSSNSSLLMSIPSELGSVASYDKEFIRFSMDYVIRLEHIKGLQEFEDFQGFFKIVKIPQINKLLSYSLDTNVYGFKSTKKKFEIEKLYLNPEAETNPFDSQPKKDSGASMMCSSKPGGINKALEF